MSTTEALDARGGATARREAEPVKALALRVAFAYSDAHNLAEALADAVTRWRKARRLLRRTSGAASVREPQHVVGWLACPQCSVEVPVAHVTAPDAQDAAGLVAVELAMADLWLHMLVHEHENG